MIGMTHNKHTGNDSLAMERQNALLDPNNKPDAHANPTAIGVNTPTNTELQISILTRAIFFELPTYNIIKNFSLDI